MEDSRAVLRQEVAKLRQRMFKHQVVNDTAVVVLTAKELDELLVFVESYLEQD